MNAPVKKKRPPLEKRLLDLPVVIWTFSIVCTLVVRLFFLLNRVERRYTEASLPYLNGERPFILCPWHGRMVFMPFLITHRRPMNVLTSKSRDGNLVATAMKCFGIRPVFGSRSRGGAEAMLAMLDLAQAGENLCITPDGPRGPNQIAAPGAAFVAAKTGFPMVPVSFASSRYRRMKSWDRFFAPLPFGRTVFTAADPIFVSPDATQDELKAATRKLTEALNNTTLEADMACEVTP